jgi:hypothetical protein
MDKDKLTYGIAIAVTVIWCGTHVVSWFSDNHDVPPTVQAAMMAIITALFSKPVLCRALKKGGRNASGCDD